MFEQFKQKYIEEVNDLLNEMEASLLSLEHQPNNLDGINNVFRVMHTIKGTCGMYNFKDVEHLTHQIENIYGKIRDNKSSVSKQLINTTLDGIDIIRLMLKQPEADNSQKLNNYINQLTSITENPTPTEQKNNTPKAGMHTYYIMLTPEADITNRGVNLTHIMNDLENIPGSIIIPHTYPDEEQYANKFYMYWEAIFATDTPYAEIEEIFQFVTDETKITILSNNNLLQNQQFVQELQRQQNTGNNFDIAQLTKFSDTTIIDTTTQPQNQTTNTPPTNTQTSQEEKIINRNIEAFENKNTNIKVNAEKLDELMNLVSELVITKAELLTIATKNNIPELDNIYEKIDKIANKFKDNALSIRLIPIESMMLRFERLVRDLSAELGKQIDFITEGIDTELDKTIIDNIAVPLMHIIRNSIDHGIETTERRRQLKKTDRGIIKFTAFYSGANVFIQIQDDGAGMNIEYLKAKAIEKGLIKPNQPVTTRQLYDFVFLPGFSTAQKITGISGRGVGMDVVKQSIIKLRGEIEMDSEPNLGTITTIKLPLTLSIVDSLLTSIGKTLLLIPLYIIDICVQIDANQLNTEKPIYIYNNQPIPVFNIRQLLELNYPQPPTSTIILVKYKEHQIGIAVDKVIGQHQAVIKPLGRYFANQEYISGASILGDGHIALVLNTNKLVTFITKQNQQ